jgi:hypothetical protein
MAHSIETASSGRAKCRGCGQKIAKGDLRLGERLPNPFGEGEMTLWFHLPCGAYKRPDVFLEALGTFEDEIETRDELRSIAAPGLEHRRLPRVDGASRSPTGRARCRHCKEFIEKDSWRIGLVFYEEGRFNPAGYIHVACAVPYLGTADIVDRLRHFSPTLLDQEVAEIRQALKV